MKKAPAKIASEDITCYKILNADLTSVMMNFQYTLGHTYKTRITKMSSLVAWSVADSLSVDIMDNKYPGWEYAGNSIRSTENLVCYSGGFHSYASEQRCYKAGYFIPVVIVECIIPKGTRYHEDLSGCYVSDTIKTAQIVETK